MRLKPVREQVVVIVGANSGIGRATAKEFARRGAITVVSGRDQDEINQLVSEIEQEGGRATGIMIADVADYAQVQTLADQAAAMHGRIDTWVHLPAVALYARFSQTTPEEFERIIHVNLLGQAYGAMTALPYLKKEGRGSLIHVSSVTARRAVPLQSAYSSAKHGIKGFLDALRLEVKEEGFPINVTNIMPASVDTPFFAKAVTKIGVKPGPLPPIYRPEQVARAIVFAAEHPSRDIFVGGASKFLSAMASLSPRLSDAMIGATAFRLQKTKEPKSADAPSNMYEHLDGYDSAHGEYNKVAKPSIYTWLRTHPAARVGLAVSVLAIGLLVPMLTLKPLKPARSSLVRDVRRKASDIKLLGLKNGRRKLLGRKDGLAAISERLLPNRKPSLERRIARTVKRVRQMV